MSNEKLKIVNTVVWEHRNPEGELLSRQERKNLIVNAGRDWLCGLIGNAAGTPAKYIALSNNSAAAAAGDTTLTSEYATAGLSRAAGTYAHTTATDNLTISKTFTCTVDGTGVQKSALFDAASTGNMFAEVLFTATTLNNNDTLTVTWTIDLGLA